MLPDKINSPDWVLRKGRQARALAKAIDFSIIIVLSLFSYPFGVVVALVYMALCDSLPNGQSIGKRLLGFCVVSVEDSGPCNLRQSFVRNLFFTLFISFLFLPGWWRLVSPLGEIICIAVESFVILRNPEGNRLGDMMASTTVNAVDGDEVGVQDQINLFGPKRADVANQ
jgi:uncharacterized RDD family membrane protein YckC